MNVKIMKKNVHYAANLSQARTSNSCTKPITVQTPCILPYATNQSSFGRIIPPSGTLDSEFFHAYLSDVSIARMYNLNVDHRNWILHIFAQLMQKLSTSTVPLRRPFLKSQLSRVSIAQWLEHWSSKPGVESSILSGDRENIFEFFPFNNLFWMNIVR